MYDGGRGHLDGLASVYCELLMAPFNDVLSSLEDARLRAWSQRSPKHYPGMNRGHRGNSNQLGMLPNSHSQPIYVPGKYSPSSCLSDKEEDEIYGFGYGCFAPRVGRNTLQSMQSQMPQQQQSLPNNSTNVPVTQQSCLSPRSAYFYELPPADGREANKKRTTLARLLRGLKTVNRRANQNASAGAQIKQTHERLRHFQMNGGPQPSFEETIHRLKVQEALRKKEKFQREHEEILRDIRQGLMQQGRKDDTYMYDDTIATSNYRNIHPHQHWYDEPPYESDPDDFLMAGLGPAATIQGARVCYTTSGPGVISLRSAGDISISQQRPIRRGLIVPQQPPNPPTIIPLKRSHDVRGVSGDYAASVSDIHSVTSRLSQVSVGTNHCTTRYRTLSGGIGNSPSPTHSSDYVDDDDDDEDDLTTNTAVLNGLTNSSIVGNSTSNGSCGTAGSTSTNVMMTNNLKSKRNNLSSHLHKTSSTISYQKATVHYSNDARNSPKDLLKDNSISFNNNNNSNSRNLNVTGMGATKDDRSSISDQAFHCSASSVESLPSASGSSTQALVRSGSPNSSLSADDRATILPICRAKAIVDSATFPYEKDALKFKKGDIIDVLSMNASGVWKGCMNGRIGHFKFINVEVMPEQKGKALNKLDRTRNTCPSTVDELLNRIGLKEYTSVFVLNGYEDLELFKELEPADLDYLGILNQEHRAKLLAAVQLLHAIDSAGSDDVAGSSSENDDSRIQKKNSLSPFGRRHFPRDSGCYEGSPLPNINSIQSNDDANCLDSVVTQCSNELMKRVDNLRRTKDDSTTPKSLNRLTKKGLLGGAGIDDFSSSRSSSGGGALSEKSSDSGVSSSSLSSGPIKNNL
ncbi:unnamed protein product [Chironomus riparius]|uniref:SAM and SH3 domain-containing protein 3 n=1 Tax=Chironomus riparius TaxID=315576 RepID=A0A9N9WVJ7_9DIPT|nr:unnamed protein product [Chironomus riparius]